MCRCVKEWTAEFEVSPNKSLRLPVGYPTPSPLTVQSPQSFRVVWWESSRSAEREGRCNACIHLTWEGPFQMRAMEEFFITKLQLWEDRSPLSLPGASKEKDSRNIRCVLMCSCLQGYFILLYFSLPMYGISLTSWAKCTFVRKSGKLTSFHNTFSVGTCVPSSKKRI